MGHDYVRLVCPERKVTVSYDPVRSDCSNWHDDSQHKSTHRVVCIKLF
jgi:hypothetical protein